MIHISTAELAIFFFKFHLVKMRIQGKGHLSIVDERVNSYQNILVTHINNP